MKIENLTKEEVKLIIPDRVKDSHKGTYGKVALLGGAIEYSGAIRLASMALAALKSGAGLSTVAVPKYLVPVVSNNILEVMIYPIESSDSEIKFSKENIDGLINKVDVLACGMGLGKSKGAHEIIYYIIKNFDGRLVLDADALNILSEDIDILNEAKCKIVLTPHMMEFKRLFDSAFPNEDTTDFSKFENDKIENAKKYLQKYDVVLLLKGSTTIVVERKDTVEAHKDFVGASSTSPEEYVGASSTSPQKPVGASSTSPDVKIKLVTSGTPGMSTAGSGDVLSGILAGFLGYIKNVYDATTVAAFVNGLAGELAARDEGEISMTASDTVKHIAEAIKNIKL